MNESIEINSDQGDKRVGQAVVLFCVCILLMLFIGIPGQAFSLTFGLIGTLLLVVLLPAVVFVRIKKIPISKGLRLNRVSPTVILTSLFVGAGAWSAAIGLHELIVQLIGPAMPTGLEVSTAKDYLIMLGLAAVLPGVCEECLFRGAIQGVLERRGQWFAILLSAAFFGIFHLDPWRMLPAAFLGCVFGWLTVRTQSILPAITAHFGNNATAFSAGFFLEDEQVLFRWVLPALGVLFVATVITASRLTAAEFGGPERDANPLAFVPAAVSTVIAWLSILFVVGFSIVSTGGIYFVTSLLTVVKMNDDALLPHIKEGDQLVLFKNGSFIFEVNGGDTVSFKRGDETVSRVVTRVEGDRVFLRDGNQEINVHVDDVIGELVQILPK